MTIVVMVLILGGDNLSKTKLLFDLILYVNTKRIFTAQDVAQELDISTRTAHRYLMDLSEMGVPLYTEPGRNGGYRILNNRLLPPIVFDENEALSIFFAFQSLKYYQSLPFTINIDSTSRKLYCNLPNDLQQKVNNLDSVLSFWNRKRETPTQFLREIIEAAMDKNILKIEYLSKSGSNFREVAPIGLYSYDGFWYMPAFDFKYNEIRQFRGDRILSLQDTNTKHEIEMSINDWFRSYKIESPIRLYVNLTSEGVRQCKSSPWLESHIIASDQGNGYIDTKIDKSELQFTAKYFLQLGTDATVIEPQEIINYIKQEAYKVINHYSD